jgi:hypothetical protein
MKNKPIPPIQRCLEIIYEAEGAIEYISFTKFENDEDKRFVDNIWLKLEAITKDIKTYQNNSEKYPGN